MTSDNDIIKQATADYLAEKITAVQFQAILLPFKIKRKICDVCQGEGNFCEDIRGKSVCGVCQLEGYK